MRIEYTLYTGSSWSAEEGVNWAGPRDAEIEALIDRDMTAEPVLLAEPLPL